MHVLQEGARSALHADRNEARSISSGSDAHTVKRGVLTQVRSVLPVSQPSEGTGGSALPLKNSFVRRLSVRRL